MKQRGATGNQGWLVAVLGWFFYSGALVTMPARDLPLIEVRQGGIVITQSCRLIIPPGTVLTNANDTGAIQIGASDLVLEFGQGSVLQGSSPETPPDQYKGCAIRLNGHRGITIRGARIRGFWSGLWASQADGLTLERMDASDNRRARLKSTALAEDEGDWLYGQDNDQKEWLRRYGAAIYIERSRGVTVRNCRVWHGQNALCLDRVSRSLFYDNDFSFNSGWGIALWRCSSNIVSRNALDFCVRGYSHGVYNRGQDSAGILAFEQNNGNIFVENSVTHGGDGFFGFAGREALGEAGEHPVKWYRGRGNSDNLLVRNDFSYAAAHGIENTFSFGNRYVKNRIVGNAICGIWAGYSRRTLIDSNEIRDNGQRGYGLERGGVNIDHGGDNLILFNAFSSNLCGVHLWGGVNPEFEKKKWAQANTYASTGTVALGNCFDGDTVAFQFRGSGEVTLGSNQLVGVTTELLDEPAYVIHHDQSLTPHLPVLLPFPIPGTTKPVGAREQLRGREDIIMTEWGPWDHVAPLVYLARLSGGSAVYAAFKVPRANLQVETTGASIASRVEPVAGRSEQARIVVSALEPGVRPFQTRVRANGKLLGEFTGTLLAAKWQVTFFKWPGSVDPRQNLEAYRKLADGPTAVSDVLDQLSFKYGLRGPSELGLSDKITAARLGRDHFGMIARTRLPLQAGVWTIVTQSDDGVRVSIDGHDVIENWTWHGPTRDTGTLRLAAPRTVAIVVEHFQIDGYAVLDFSLERSTQGAARQNH